MDRRLLWTLLSICAVAAFVAFAYPMYVIRPFRAQGPRELSLALVVRTWGPFVAPVAAGIAILLAVLLWHSARRWTRAISLLATALTVLFAVLSHVNVYEMMFHRIDAPETMPGSAAKLERDDMVLAIDVAGLARAYPIRMLGYHHIVNDWLGDVPVVATY